LGIKTAGITRPTPRSFIAVCSRSILRSSACFPPTWPSWTVALEAHWREAITAIVVPMLEGAAVHTAMMAERRGRSGRAPL